MLELAENENLGQAKTWHAKAQRAYKRAIVVLPLLTVIFMSVELIPFLSHSIQSWGEWGMVSFRALTFSLLYFFVRDYYRCKAYAQIERHS